MWTVDSFSLGQEPWQRQRRAAASPPCHQYDVPSVASHVPVLCSSRIRTSLSLEPQSTEHNGDTTRPPAMMERTWRHVKKPLLRIGAKGASASHGNSLRQLLDDHTVVKVKINTSMYNGDLETAFESLKELAVTSGASSDMELLQCRAAEQVILVSLPGTRKRIESGDFPPPKPTEEAQV